MGNNNFESSSNIHISTSRKGESSSTSKLDFFARLFLYFGFGIILSFIILFFVQRVAVDGSSMEPTFSDGQSLYINKQAYSKENPSRYDIVVFPYEDRYLIKRVIALPGETIYIDEYGQIYIDGILLNEPNDFDSILFVGMLEEPFTLSENEYFVLGDNRNNSLDSRSFGPVPFELLVGKIIGY